MSIDTSVGRVEGVRVSIDTSVQVSGQGSNPVGYCWVKVPWKKPTLAKSSGVPQFSQHVYENAYYLRAVKHYQWLAMYL